MENLQHLWRVGLACFEILSISIVSRLLSRLCILMPTPCLRWPNLATRIFGVVNDSRKLRAMTTVDSFTSHVSRVFRIPRIPISSWWSQSYCPEGLDTPCGHSGFKWEESSDCNSDAGHSESNQRGFTARRLLIGGETVVVIDPKSNANAVQSEAWMVVTIDIILMWIQRLQWIMIHFLICKISGNSGHSSRASFQS